MKQYGKRFTYFVSLLVSGYLFWGRRIYIHWPIKWPLGIFNGGAAWSLLALANVCLCVIEYFMGSSKFSAETLLISSFTILLHYLFTIFSCKILKSAHCTKPTLTLIFRLFISRMCLSLAFICWLFIFLSWHLPSVSTNSSWSRRLSFIRCTSARVALPLFRSR